MNSKVVDELILELNKFQNEAIKVIDKNSPTKKNLESFLFLKVLERFYINIDSIIVLLVGIQNHPHREFSLKLIIRTNLLDFIIITYLTTFISSISSEVDKENEDIYLLNLEKILCEQASYEIKNIKLLHDKGIITAQEYKRKIEILIAVFSIYFEKDIDYNNPVKSLKYSKFISITEMFKKISANEITSKFSNVYELYQKFSKYEHIGLLTHYYQSEKFEQIMNDIIFGLKFCIKGSLFCIHMLNHDEKSLEAIKEIEENIKRIKYI